MTTESDLVKRITVNPKIFGGKPIIRGRRLAVGRERVEPAIDAA
jgi:uncharacterized protein (DUF433 family)